MGPSGSGKTTIIESLIRRFVEQGHSVGAIKHTHHPLNEDDRGDTRRFRLAGAGTIILAGERDAVIFGDPPRQIHYQSPGDLLSHFATDIVLVEGFKSFAGWPRVEMRSDLTAESVADILDRIWRP